MADTVWRSLNPNISAKRSCESLPLLSKRPDPPADQLCRHRHLRTYSCTFQCASVICDLCTARNIPEVSSATARGPPRSGAVPNARIRRRPGGSPHARGERGHGVGGSAAAATRIRPKSGYLGCRGAGTRVVNRPCHRRHPSSDNEAVTTSWSIVPSAGTWGSTTGVTP